jgi:hypothetical protein
MRRLSLVTAGWAAVYTTVHAGWALTGPPDFRPPGESFLPTGWLPVAIGAAVLLAALCDGWWSALLGWAATAAAAAYSFMFPLSLVQVCGALFGAPVSGRDVATLLAQGSGAVLGWLAGAVAVRALRRARGVRVRAAGAATPWWAYAAGYTVVACCVARLVAEVLHGFLRSRSPDTPWAYLLVFVGLLTLSGTLLPLALVHGWGRTWPAWVPLLARRRVPRWLVLGPALFVGAGLTGYFGIGGVVAWARGDVDGDWFLAVALTAYTLWGVGLLVAGAAYSVRSRPAADQDQHQQAGGQRGRRSDGDGRGQAVDRRAALVLEHRTEDRHP